MWIYVWDFAAFHTKTRKKKVQHKQKQTKKLRKKAKIRLNRIEYDVCLCVCNCICRFCSYEHSVKRDFRQIRSHLWRSRLGLHNNREKDGERVGKCSLQLTTGLIVCESSNLIIIIFGCVLKSPSMDTTHTVMLTGPIANLSVGFLFVSFGHVSVCVCYVAARNEHFQKICKIELTSVDYHRTYASYKR